MKVTFILKDLSDAFYNGGHYAIGLNNLNDFEKWLYLKYRAERKELQITMKVRHADAFRDKIELNQILRAIKSISYKLEPRRGYKLATFEIC